MLVTSVDVVAKYFDKNRTDINRKIKNIVKNMPSLSREFYRTTYINERGQTHPIYYMTEKGFTILVMKFTGQKALEW